MQRAVQVDAHNLLAHVDAADTLLSLARSLAAQGFVLPLARPLPRIAMLRAAVALPFVIDALTQQITGAALDGSPFETVAAPRSATGPSLVAAVSTRPPLATLMRARVRVARQAQSRIFVAELATERDAAQLLLEVAHEARALAVEAVGSRVIGLIGTGTRSALSRYEPVGEFVHPRGGWLSSTRSIGALDGEAILHALGRGERVLCAPFMGRAAVGMRARFVSETGRAGAQRAAVEAVLRAMSHAAVARESA